MSSKIRVLSENTINKIAAGEVIENPASVVKELVENSLDAGANEICVEIKGGGRQLIRVSDNGCGMSADDALLCLERHATSKIRDVEEIHSIHTMGFRGEAIPSIASISKFMLLTALHPENGQPREGTMVIVDGGTIVKCCPAACSPGTTIEIKSLFFNVPVRKKFQKSPAYDTTEILKMLSILALGNPAIKFQLISNEETLLNAPLPMGKTFDEQLKERIRAILGADFYNGTCSVNNSKGELELQGAVGLPAYTRHNRTGQYLFINRRGVFSPLISYAVREGYGPSMSPNRHPIYVLHLKMPGSLVDVNVHPQKKEVRLRQDQMLKEWIIHSVENSLQQEGISSFHELPSLPLSIQMPPSFFSEPEPPPFFTYAKKPEPKLCFSATSVQPQAEAPPSLLFSEPIRSQPILPQVLATIPGYILIDPKALPQFNPESLCLVDQRSAHFRVIYEKLENRNAGTPPVQALLIPYTLETTPTEASALKEQIDSLNQLGIAIKEFGATTFLIDALPSIFGSIDIGELLGDLLKHMRDYGDASLFRREQKRLIAQAASRAAISKSKRLNVEEAQGLINQLMRCQTPFACPFGKATVLQMTGEELAKQFQKV